MESEKKKPTAALALILFTALLLFSVIFIDDIKKSVIESSKVCAFTIIPSLFFVCIISKVITDSNLMNFMLLKSNINADILTAFILGNIGGYPMGAKVLSELVKEQKISPVDAEKAICFTFASGPAFILGIVSQSVFKCGFLGIIAFISVFLSNLTLYILYLIKHKYKAEPKPIRFIFSTESVLSAVNSAAYSMINIGSSVVFFAALLAILHKLFPKLSNVTAISAFLEISNILKFKYSDAFTFSAACVLLSFGGLCVHMQIKSISGGCFGLKLFYLTRPVQLLMTAVYSFSLYQIASKYISVSTHKPNIIFSQSNSALPFVCMIGMMVISFMYKKRRTV